MEKQIFVVRFEGNHEGYAWATSELDAIKQVVGEQAIDGDGHEDYRFSASVETSIS